MVEPPLVMAVASYGCNSWWQGNGDRSDIWRITLDKYWEASRKSTWRVVQALKMAEGSPLSMTLTWSIQAIQSLRWLLDQTSYVPKWASQCPDVTWREHLSGHSSSLMLLVSCSWVWGALVVKLAKSKPRVWKWVCRGCQHTHNHHRTQQHKTPNTTKGVSIS